MITKAQVEPEGLAYERLRLWFFRECNQGTRRQLFSIFGLPVNEITNHGTEMVAFKHILAALEAGEA